MRVTLTRIHSTHRNLRTDTVDGHCDKLPEVGCSFLLVGESLESPGAAFVGVRVVTTSIVQEVIRGMGALIFRTENSTYELKVHDKPL